MRRKRLSANVSRALGSAEALGEKKNDGALFREEIKMCRMVRRRPGSMRSYICTVSFMIVLTVLTPWWLAAG